MNMKESLLKDKKLTSEKLRIENKKMELRLQQLKLAMNKEKEDRLSNGIQSNWSTGSPGALLNYKPLSSSLNNNKKIKLKMLKEVMVTPKLTNNVKINVLRDIGGYDFMSSKNVLTTDLKEIDNIVNFRSCGQCEENSAAVNCKECAEDYCPKCFAAFHLKGALRKHRSTPISTINNRVSIPSPLFKPVDLKNVSNMPKRYKSSFENNEIKNNCFSTNESQMESDENSKENDFPNYYEPSLADGNYNEEAASRYFQEAIYAWRNNTELSETQNNMQKLETVENSTETVITENGNKKLLSDLIQFTSSMTYAEQLLLRKHRNTQISPNNLKYGQSYLSDINETDILENQKLLQSNLILKTALANNFENAVKDIQNHVDFDCVYQLLYEADLIEGRKSSIQSEIRIKDRNSLKIESLDFENIQKYNEILTCDKLKQNESSNCDLNNFQIYKTNNLVDYKLQQNDNNTKGCEGPLIKQKNSRSFINRNVFYARPMSGRKLLTRNDKGGKLTSKPSTLLNLMAKFGNYLYHDHTNEEIISKVSSKLSYNFYNLSFNSWKPSYSLSNEVHDFKYPNDISSISSENVNKDIETELNKLNLLSDEIKISNTSLILETSKSNDGFLSKCNSSNENEFDEEKEELESINNFDKYDREVTIISKLESAFTFHNSNQDDILTDSLEISNQCLNSIDSFDLE